MIDSLATLDLPDRVCTVLGLQGGPLTLRRAWPRGVEHLLLEYVATDGTLVPGQWMDDEEALRKVAKKTAAACPEAPSALVRTPVGRVLLHARGADRHLPALAALVAREDATLLVHRPERRAVLRLDPGDGKGDRPRFVKVVRPKKLPRLLKATAAIECAKDRPFRVPMVLAIDEAGGSVVWSALPGQSLRDLAEDDARFIDGMGQAGTALRWLHDRDPAHAVPHDGACEIRLLATCLERVRRFAPDVAHAAGAAAPDVFRALATGAQPTALLHRDFHDKQVFIDPDHGPGLLDFDTLAGGEPALDVANMLVHLELRVLQKRCSWSTASRGGAMFLDGYAPDGSVRGRINAYVAATRLRLACVYALRPQWRDVVLPLAETAGRRSMGALCQSLSSMS